MYFKGFRLGLMLQLAVGPVCLLVFQTAYEKGIINALSGVLAVAIVDAIYIIMALLGMGILLNRYQKAKSLIQIIGALILILFGLNIVLNQWGIKWMSLPSMGSDSQHTFINLFILTLSNPLTIVFWAGVFSTQLTGMRNELNKRCAFAIGAVSSTLVFLSFVTIIGALIQIYFTDTVICVLNIIIAILIIGFGISMLLKYKKDKINVSV